MNEFLENFKKDLAEIWENIRTTYAKLVGRPAPKAGGSVVSSTVSSTYEINLVPEVKAQMIKALRMRNLVLFICIVVSSVAAGVVMILFGIKSGQDIAMSNQDKKLEQMSEKLNGYDELRDLVTIQGQLNGIDKILGQKTVLSRVFGAMGAMLPQGGDEVKLSELRVNLGTNAITIEGQADAKTEPAIDYRVLESFKKGVALTKYDYGRYVDIDGKEIPTQCISEADAEGNAYHTGDSYYAWWDLTIKGCEATKRSLNEDPDIEFHYSSDAEVEMGYVGDSEEQTGTDTEQSGVESPVTVSKEQPIKVKIWRTPQFTKWYDKKLMTLDGDITQIEHFESVCYRYSGTETPGTTVAGITGKPTVRWSSMNDCLLAPDGLEIASSSNGRDESDNLVLRFSASTIFADEFFAFANKHMMAIGPTGQNVTDSFIQIGNMFTQEARECDVDDTECLSNSTNSGRSN